MSLQIKLPNYQAPDPKTDLPLLGPHDFSPLFYDGKSNMETSFIITWCTF